VIAPDVEHSRQMPGGFDLKRIMESITNGDAQNGSS
jgi:hypothetical protein